MTSNQGTESLHKVTKEELPILFEWVSKYLPNSYKIYGTIYQELHGKWPGATYYTLGWPEIRAVGDGPVDEAESKCPDFFNHVRHLNVFSPDPVALEDLATRPEFLDWTKPILTHANCHNSTDVLERLSNATGTPYNRRTTTNIMVAYPGDIAPRPVTEGFKIQPLDQHLHAEFITSTWPHRRRHTESYITALLEAFHSVGIFDWDGNCVAFEVENEYGFSALLYVKDEFRGLGLATCVVSQLAQKFFQENRPILAAVIGSNKPAVAVHEKLGFKKIGYLDWLVHSMTSEKIMASG